MNIEELKRLAEAATPGPWFDDAGAIRTNEVQYVKPIAIVYSLRNSVFIAAANPAAILELIQQRDELLVALKALDRGCRDPRCIGVLHGLDLARTAIAKAEG